MVKGRKNIDVISFFSRAKRNLRGLRAFIKRNRFWQNRNEKASILGVRRRASSSTLPYREINFPFSRRSIQTDRRFRSKRRSTPLDLFSRLTSCVKISYEEFYTAVAPRDDF
jgi:hypothetical protein